MLLNVGNLINATVEDAQTAGHSTEEIDAAINGFIVGQYVDMIDDICDSIYTRSASRAARYKQKLEEALSYKAAGSPGAVPAADYPTLIKESAARGITKDLLADMIIARAAAFADFGAEAEVKRVLLSAEVAAAATEAEKETIAKTAVIAIHVLAAALV